MNYAAEDQKRILSYLHTHKGACSVEELFSIDSIEKLRIFPLIYRMKENGLLTITEYDELGSPLRILLK